MLPSCPCYRVACSLQANNADLASAGNTQEGTVNPTHLQQASVAKSRISAAFIKGTRVLVYMLGEEMLFSQERSYGIDLS